jgi:hypothetical protein
MDTIPVRKSQTFAWAPRMILRIAARRRASLPTAPTSKSLSATQALPDDSK